MSGRLPAALAAVALAVAAAGCSTDDAVERDAREAAPEIEREAGEIGRDLEEAAPGDVDDDGR